MPVHDWTRVDEGIFHDFHLAWVAELTKALNRGWLPKDHYALIEHHHDSSIEGLLTLPREDDWRREAHVEAEAVTVAQMPSRAVLRRTYRSLRRSIAIRHERGHRLVALIEMVSPPTKDSGGTVDIFASKIVEALDAGMHVLMVDVLPPGWHDPKGMHGIVRRRLSGSDDRYDLPRDQPLTLASYAAGPAVDMYLEHVSPGDRLPAMP